MSLRILYLAAAAWAGLAVVALLSGLAAGAAWPGPVPWGRLASVEVASLVVWTGLTVPVYRLASQLEFDPRHRLRTAAVQFAAGVPFVVLAAVADGLFVRALVPAADRTTILDLLPGFDARVVAYLAIVMVVQSTRYFRLYRERELATAELEARLAKTKLQVLKMQLQPHFLFNTLNTTAELVHADPDAADAMITRLGDFLRLSLDHAGHQVVPLRQELDFIRAYVEIEQIRYQDRLQVTWANDADALDAAVPTLLWQPVLENAIRHGREPSSGVARIEVGARLDGVDVVLWIRDHGPGLPADGKTRERVGLRNTRERVEQLYGARGRFTLENAPGGGAVAALRIPYVACAHAHTPLPLRTSELEAILP
jgi:signal transduction histidine kinase